MTIWVLSCIGVMSIIWLIASIVYGKPIKLLPSKSINLSLYENSLADLQKSYEKGKISAEELNALSIDLKKQLLEDSTVNASNNQYQLTSNSHQFSHFLIVFLSIIFFSTSSWFLYQRWGSLDGVAAYQKNIALGEKAEIAFKKIVIDLNNQLKENENDTQAWYFLARTYMRLSDYDSAIVAYERVLKLAESSSDLLSEVAQAQYISDQYSSSPKVVKYLEQSLKLDKNHMQTLRLLGQIALDQQDYQKAKNYLERIYVQLSDGDEKRQLKRKIDELTINFMAE